MWNCEVCGAGTPESCKCLKAPPQDTKHAMDALDELAARCERYETALRKIATATGYPPKFPREGWGYLQEIARKALKETK